MKKENTGKTPEYVKNAVNRYRQTHKVRRLTFDLDAIQRLDAVGLTSEEIRRLVMEELERREQAGN